MPPPPPPPPPCDVSRESWGSRASFLLACVGYAVGLGNVWRFPYLCYKSGGGAFMLPYAVMLALCGVPLLYMELLAGQYARRGPVGALAKMCPLLKGAGAAAVVISFWLCTYYNVILSWAMVYLSASFSDPLPWTGCHNWWNTGRCWDVVEDNHTAVTSSQERTSSTQEFYDHRVLQKTSGLGDLGQVRWELLGYLAVAWVAVYFCLWKSVRATGKVVYVTATLPYFLLIVFLARSVTLPGAEDGLRFLFEPRWEEMLQPKVWVYAAAQVFNSLGVGFGSLVAFSSYNRFHHGPVLRDALVVASVDAATCVLCGACVFATLGALARDLGKEVGDVAEEGPGLVFVALPHALTRLPAPQVWSAIFFAMLLMLGIDSQFATVEVIVTSLKDFLSSSRTAVTRAVPHELLVLLVCAVAFAFGLPHVTSGGVYAFVLVDYYAAAVSLMYIAFFECAAVLWCYGANRLASNARDMDGQRAPAPLVACWRFVSPVIIFVIWAFNLAQYAPPTYANYRFPWWGLALGWGVAATSLAAIPAGAVHSLLRAKGNILQRFRHSLTSTIVVCPCGCEASLDEDHSAHKAGSRTELILPVEGGCPEGERADKKDGKEGEILLRT